MCGSLLVQVARLPIHSVHERSWTGSVSGNTHSDATRLLTLVPKDWGDGPAPPINVPLVSRPASLALAGHAGFTDYVGLSYTGSILSSYSPCGLMTEENSLTQ